MNAQLLRNVLNRLQSSGEQVLNIDAQLAFIDHQRQWEEKPDARNKIALDALNILQPAVTRIVNHCKEEAEGCALGGCKEDATAYLELAKDVLEFATGNKAPGEPAQMFDGLFC